MNLVDNLLDPNLCLSNDGVPNFPMLILAKILKALPSESAFSIQLLISSWNYSGLQPEMESGNFSDIYSLTDAMVKNLQLKWEKIPFFTQYLGNFTCESCGQVYRRKHWQGQLFSSVPVLHLPKSSGPVDPLILLQLYIDMPFTTCCPDVCCQNITKGGKIEVVPGRFTILIINRVCYETLDKQMNAVSFSSLDMSPDRFNPGHLISLICHRGDVNTGHFVSYQPGS